MSDAPERDDAVIRAAAGLQASGVWPKWLILADGTTYEFAEDGIWGNPPGSYEVRAVPIAVTYKILK